MARRKRSSSDDRLAALRAKLEGMDLGGGNFWKPQVGRSTVRILPGVGDMEWFFCEVGQHFIDGTAHFCPHICTDGEDACPICEVNQALWTAGEKDAASKLRVRRSFWMNIVVRAHEDQGVRIYTPGITVFRVIVALIGDPDYGDITDLEDGSDVKILREGEGLNTKYQVLPGKQPCALSDDMEEIEEWMEDATDLDDFVMSQLKTYDELVTAAGLEAYLDVSDDAPEADEEEEEAASTTIEKRLARRPARRRKR